MKTKKILLIEDNPGDQDLLVEAFKKNGKDYQIDTVEDGEAAWLYLNKEYPYAQAEDPNLIILDLNMPIKNGKDLIKDIKNSEYLKQIPVIVLTSSDSPKDVLESYKLHANCYVKKPLNASDFWDLIKSLDNFWLEKAVLPQ